MGTLIVPYKTYLPRFWAASQRERGSGLRFNKKVNNKTCPYFVSDYRWSFNTRILSCLQSCIRKWNNRHSTFWYTQVTEKLQAKKEALRPRPCYVGGIWKRWFYSENASNVFCTHYAAGIYNATTTTTTSTTTTITITTATTQQSPIILDLCLRGKLGQGLSQMIIVMSSFSQFGRSSGLNLRPESFSMRDEKNPQTFDITCSPPGKWSGLSLKTVKSYFVVHICRISPPSCILIVFSSLLAENGAINQSPPSNAVFCLHLLLPPSRKLQGIKH